MDPESIHIVPKTVFSQLLGIPNIDVSTESGDHPNIIYFSLDSVSGRLKIRQSGSWKEFTDLTASASKLGAGLSSSDGTNLTGDIKRGAVVENVVSSVQASYPSSITNGQVVTFNGPTLQRCWSLLKDRDSNAFFTQYYNATGVGQGWKNISGFELDANGNAVIDNTKKVGNGTANSDNWTQYGNGATIHNVPTGQQHLFYQNGAVIAGINGDGKLYLDGAGDGIILKSPDGTQYELTVPNGGGSVTITAV